MASLYLLIPVSLIFCALAIWIFFWAVNNGQYDDLEGEADRILFDEDDDSPLKVGQEKGSSSSDNSEHKDT